MRTAIPSFFAILLLTVSIRAGTVDEANALYKSGDFARAATAYDQLLQSEGASASRLYNLGNARCHLKQYGPAILAYERALLISPRDADIRSNLKIARDAAAVNDEVASDSWWEYPLQWCSLHEWSWLTVTGAVSFAGAALAWGLQGMQRAWLKPAILVTLAGGFTLAALGGFAVWHRRGETSLGIVVAEKPTLRLSPFATAESAGDCVPGRTVQLGDHVSGWVHVKLRGSETAGWLREDEIGALMP